MFAYEIGVSRSRHSKDTFKNGKQTCLIYFRPIFGDTCGNFIHKRNAARNIRTEIFFKEAFRSTRYDELLNVSIGSGCVDVRTAIVVIGFARKSAEVRKRTFVRTRLRIEKCFKTAITLDCFGLVKFVEVGVRDSRYILPKHIRVKVFYIE